MNHERALLRYRDWLVKRVEAIKSIRDLLKNGEHIEAELQTALDMLDLILLKEEK